MNVFGDDRSIGLPGKDGKDAFDLIRRTAVAVRRLYTESESVNIYFNSATDGLVYENKKPIGLLNRGLNHNAILLGGKFPELEQIEESTNYMLKLENSIFKINPVHSGTVTHSTVIFAFSFKPLSNSEMPRILFSNERGTRVVSQYNKKLESILL